MHAKEMNDADGGESRRVHHRTHLNSESAVGHGRFHIIPELRPLHVFIFRT
jgi:hypothetical protein